MWHVWFALLIPWAAASASTEADEFFRVCTRNARGSILVVPHTNNSNVEEFIAQLEDLSNSRGQEEHINLRVEAEMESYNDDEDSLVVVTTDTQGNWTDVLHMMSRTTVTTAYWAIMGAEDIQSVVDRLNQTLRSYSQGAHFYLMISPSDVGQAAAWKRVISVQDLFYPVISPLRFDDLGFVIEEYDLEGMPLRSLDMEWDPYLLYKGCDSDVDDVYGRDCNTTGNTYFVMRPFFVQIFDKQYLTKKVWH